MQYSHRKAAALPPVPLPTVPPPENSPSQHAPRAAPHGAGAARRSCCGSARAAPPAPTSPPPSRPAPRPPPLTADPRRGVEALRLLQEAAGSFGLVGLDGGQRDADTPLRLVPVRLHGGGGRPGRGRCCARGDDVAAAPPRGPAPRRTAARAGARRPRASPAGSVPSRPGGAASRHEIEAMRFVMATRSERVQRVNPALRVRAAQTSPFLQEKKREVHEAGGGRAWLVRPSCAGVPLGPGQGEVPGRLLGALPHSAHQTCEAHVFGLLQAPHQPLLHDGHKLLVAQLAIPCKERKALGTHRATTSTQEQPAQAQGKVYSMSRFLQLKVLFSASHLDTNPGKGALVKVLRSERQFPWCPQ